MLNTPEGGSKPDPSCETEKILTNPKCLKGVKVDPASVLVLALLKDLETLKHAMPREREMWRWVILCSRGVLSRNGVGVVRVVLYAL